MRFSVLYNVFIATAAALVLPEPDGPYRVAIRSFALTDENRMDPLASSNSLHQRKLMISMFWPVENEECCSSTTIPYMSSKTAEIYGLTAGTMGLSNDTFENFEIGVCNIQEGSWCTRKSWAKYPLAILSPAAGNSRYLYSALAKSLSSKGYIVVTVDHPYDADIVEFSDGEVIFSNGAVKNTAYLEKATKVRAEDLSFVLSQFKDSQSRNAMTTSLPGSVDLEKVVALGHSLGGATAAQATLMDHHFIGGVNLDGQLFDPVLSSGLDKPFFLLGRPEHRWEDISWLEFWKKLRGSKVEMEVVGARYGSFTDLPLLLHSLDLPDQYQSRVKSLVGSLKGVQLISDTISKFFSLVFQGEADKLIGEDSSDLILVDEHIASSNWFWSGL